MNKRMVLNAKNTVEGVQRVQRIYSGTVSRLNMHFIHLNYQRKTLIKLLKVVPDVHGRKLMIFRHLIW